MRQEDIDAIKAGAAQIKNETAAGANTALRVGGWMEDAASELELQAQDHDALKARLDEVDLRYLYAYGVQWDTGKPGTALTRIGNTDLHISKPVHAAMRRGLQTADQIRYLHPTDSTKLEDGTDAVLDGSQGNVMVHVPEHWYRIEELAGGKVNIWLSMRQLSGFQRRAERSVGAFEMAMNNVAGTAGSYYETINRGWSVVNNTTAFRGGNNQDTWDALPKSQLGMPRTSKNRDQFMDAAKLNGAGYHIVDYDTHCMLWMLFLTDYAEINTDKTALGWGVSNAATTPWDISKWNTFNAYHPIIPCGRTLSLGNANGTAPYTVPGEAFAFAVPSFRGIENPFAHLYEHMCGVNIQRVGAKQTAYIYANPLNYESGKLTQWDRKFDFIRTSGYIKKIVLGTFCDILPAEGGGSSTTYLCDYAEQPSGTSDGIFAVLRSGPASAGAYCGFAFASTNPGATITAAYIGSRLCFTGRLRPV